MRILEFYKNYPTEEACREKFKEFRLKVGVKCKKCGSKEHYWKKIENNGSVNNVHTAQP